MRPGGEVDALILPPEQERDRREALEVGCFERVVARRHR